MSISNHEPRGTGTAMPTNGVGNRVDWLNLTVSMADVAARGDLERDARRQARHDAYQRYLKRHQPYAGFESGEGTR